MLLFPDINVYTNHTFFIENHYLLYKRDLDKMAV